MDTGIGHSSYSLMAQGQIDQILSAHPEDRRTIFEEAAGINKYKHQKKEALRKLEYTEANLVRITDIIKEVKRQIISLQRQAGKARRYKELFETELKGIDTRLARHKYDLLLADVTNLESQITNFVAQSDAFATQITEKEQQIADLRRSLLRKSNAPSAKRFIRITNSRASPTVISSARRPTPSASLNLKNSSRTITAKPPAPRRRFVFKKICSRRSMPNSSRLIPALLPNRPNCKASRTPYDSSRPTFRRKIFRWAKPSQRWLISRTPSPTARNELAGMDQKKKYDVVRGERLSTERLQLEDQRRALEQRVQTYNDGLAELRGDVNTLRAALTAKQSELSEASLQVNVASQTHQAGMTDASQKGARLDVLRQFFAAPDGRTTLGNILDVEPQYGAAIEAALHHAIHTILADDLNAARQLLTSGLQNPSVVAPESPRAHSESSIGEVPQGAMAWASAVARVRDARFEPLVRSLLQGVIIAGDLDVALSLRQYHPHLAVATLQGELVDAHGILSAVSKSHIAEISELSQQVTELQARVAGQETAKVELEQKKAALETELSVLRTDLHAKEVTLAAKEGELNALATEGRDLESKVHTVVSELQSIEQQDAEEKQRREAILVSLRGSEKRQGELRQQMNLAQRGVDELLGRKEQMTQQLTELRVSVGGIEHKRRAIESQREPIAARVRDLHERMEICSTEITSYTAKIAQFQVEIQESAQKICRTGCLPANNRSNILAACSTSGAKWPPALNRQRKNCAVFASRPATRNRRNPVLKSSWRRSGWKARTSKTASGRSTS